VKLPGDYSVSFECYYTKLILTFLKLKLPEVYSGVLKIRLPGV
jgi:hypothetical protein